MLPPSFGFREDGFVAMKRDVQKISEGGAEVVLDLRFYPLVITTWYGTATRPLADAFVTWQERLFADVESSGERIVVISDVTRCGRPPGDARKRFADASTPELVLDNLVVVTDPNVRGAYMAVRWLAGDRIRMRFTDNLPEAMQIALNLLDQAKIERPRRLRADRYELPEAAQQLAR